MAYYDRPPWARLAQRALLGARYLSLFGVGVVTLLFEDPALVLVGWGLIGTSAAAIFGVLTGLYRWEWVALLPMAAALGAAEVLLVRMGGSSYAVLGLLSVVIFSLVDRWVHLTRVANRQRAIPRPRVRKKA